MIGANHLVGDLPLLDMYAQGVVKDLRHGRVP
jgi:hypothetical protein